MTSESNLMPRRTASITVFALFPPPSPFYLKAESAPAGMTINSVTVQVQACLEQGSTTELYIPQLQTFISTLLYKEVNFRQVLDYL